ncbi:histone deacetylase family protein [Maricaulaceae bacterium MS644]
MKTRVLTHSSGLEQRAPEGHPEHAGRLKAALDGARAAGFDVVQSTLKADRAALERVHMPALIDQVFDTEPKAGWAQIDMDTYMGPGSLDAALYAAGAGMEAVDQVMAGDAEAVFVAARPPGHHAEPDRAMGFCLFNSIAVAASHALGAHGLSRVAVVDFDVHHGNGTQAWAETESRALFASIHQGWIYPGTGAAHETGRHGNIINLPMERGTAGPAWRAALEARVFPALARFEPELILVSAGFDAHAADPLAGLSLLEDDFAWAGTALAEAARALSASRLVCMLEGGYDCPALARSVGAFLGALEAA